jgi:hypothetical protein
MKTARIYSDTPPSIQKIKGKHDIDSRNSLLGLKNLKITVLTLNNLNH